MGRDPVMNHTPNIAENNVVARRDGGKTIKETEGHRVGGQITETSSRIDAVCLGWMSIRL